MHLFFSLQLMLVGYFLAFIGLFSNILVSAGGQQDRKITNCLLASEGAALVSFALKRTGYFGDRSSTKALINGSLAGLVSILFLFFSLFSLMDPRPRG